MRSILISLSLVLLASPAFAQAEANSTSMSCAQATALLKEKGAVVFSTGGGDFGRYVADGALCGEGQTTDPAWIPTSDQPQCLVGNRCVAAHSNSK